MSSKNVLINITTDPVETKHISWHVFEDGNSIVLLEIVENYYNHPEAPGYALISKIETVVKDRVTKGSIKSSPLNQLKDALNTINLLYEGENADNQIIS